LKPWSVTNFTIVAWKFTTQATMVKIVTDHGFQAALRLFSGAWRPQEMRAQTCARSSQSLPWTPHGPRTTLPAPRRIAARVCLLHPAGGPTVS